MPNSTDPMQREYELAIDQYKACWATYAQALGVAMTGIFIGLILVVANMPDAEPLLILFPFLVLAWMTLVGIQNNELCVRGWYVGAIEKQLRLQIGGPLPCIETRLRPFVYRSPQYLCLVGIMGIPFGLIYIATAVVALRVLQDLNEYIAWTLAGVYLILPVLSAAIIWRMHRGSLAEASLLSHELTDRQEPLRE